MTRRTVYARDLYDPAGQSRSQRRAHRRAAAHLITASRAHDRQERRAAAARLRDERNDAQYLPAGGESGPAALRSWRRFRLPPHQATSAVLASAYPFLAEGGLGAAGTLIGQDLYSGGSFCYDPWVLYEHGVITNPNVLLAGVIGTGKSACAKALTTRSLAFGRHVYVPGDPKGEWTAVAAAVGGHTIALGPGRPARLNPLDAGQQPHGMPDTEWRTTVWQRRRSLTTALAETVLHRPLNPTEHTALDTALHALTATAGAGSTPTMTHLVNLLLDPRPDTASSSSSSAKQLRDDGRDTAHALRRLVHGDLAGLFDGPTTVALDPDTPMLTLDLSGVNGSDDLLSLVMTCTSAWMEAALTTAAPAPRWVVYDEAWRLMRQPALIRRMQSQWKLSRAYGIANLMIIHRLSDLDAVGDTGSEIRALAHGLLADCSTRIIYRQETDQLISTRTTLGLTDTQQALLPDLGIGEGLWRINNLAHLVQHQMTPVEHDLFDTANRMRTSSGGA